MRSLRSDRLRRASVVRPQLRAQRAQLLVQRAYVLLENCDSLFVRHRSPLGEAARTIAPRALRAAVPSYLMIVTVDVAVCVTGMTIPSAFTVSFIVCVDVEPR